MIEYASVVLVVALNGTPHVPRDFLSWLERQLARCPHLLVGEVTESKMVLNSNRFLSYVELNADSSTHMACSVKAIGVSPMTPGTSYVLLLEEGFNSSSCQNRRAPQLSDQKNAVTPDGNEVHFCDALPIARSLGELPDRINVDLSGKFMIADKQGLGFVEFSYCPDGEENECNLMARQPYIALSKVIDIAGSIRNDSGR